jgi:hypothetical protein
MTLPAFYTGSAPAQLIGVNDGTDDCIFVTDGTDLRRLQQVAQTQLLARLVHLRLSLALQQMAQTITLSMAQRYTEVQ